MRFLFLFAFHELVDAWRKFVNSVSKVIMLYDTIGIASYSRGVMMGGKGGAIPWAPNYGSTESLGGAPKSPNNVTSTFFNSRFASKRPQDRKWGRQTCFLSRCHL